ncbi:MAG: hypothetical protein KGP14_07635 [Betaproteobacteria bacterium]|nr:hypothetical protein [Betaproteobacteria bacterium]
MMTMVWVGLGAMIGAVLGIGVFVAYAWWRYEGIFEMPPDCTKHKRDIYP